MTALSVGGVKVATLATGEGLPAGLVPRPFLHPLRTLSGQVVTGSQPADHPHHLGLGVGIPLVGGSNLWGGPTFEPAQGYRWLHDHGRQELVALTEAVDHLTLEVVWRGAGGEPLLAETREIGAAAVPGVGDAWRLTHRSTLTNVTGAALELASPAARGRQGAAYGGVFWRGPAGLAAAEVESPGRQGEDAVNGSPGDPVVLKATPAGSTGGWSLVLRDLAPGEEPAWFVRVAEYLGAGPSLVRDVPRVLPPGAELVCGLEVVVVDGPIGMERAAGLIGAP